MVQNKTNFSLCDLTIDFCFFHLPVFFVFFCLSFFYFIALLFFLFHHPRNHLCAILKETLSLFFVVEIHTHTQIYRESQSESQRETNNAEAACAARADKLIKEWVATRS